MTVDEILERIRKLPENERRELVQQVLDEFTEYDDELTPEQIAELDRRAEDALKNPGRGKSFEEVSAEIKKEFLDRK
jgi:putative addiction module component (TIGR02574 family)